MTVGKSSFKTQTIIANLVLPCCLLATEEPYLEFFYPQETIVAHTQGLSGRRVKHGTPGFVPGV